MMFGTRFLPCGPRQLIAKLWGVQLKVYGKKWLPSRSVKELEALAPKTNPNKNKQTINQSINQTTKQPNKQTDRTRPNQTTKPKQTTKNIQKYILTPVLCQKPNLEFLFLAIFFSVQKSKVESHPFSPPHTCRFPCRQLHPACIVELRAPTL